MLETFPGSDIQSAISIIKLLCNGTVISSEDLLQALDKEIKTRAAKSKI